LSCYQFNQSGSTNGKIAPAFNQCGSAKGGIAGEVLFCCCCNKQANEYHIANSKIGIAKHENA